MKKLLTFICCGLLLLVSMVVLGKDVKASDLDLVNSDLESINIQTTVKSNFPVPTRSFNGTEISYSTTTPEVLDLTYVESDGWVLVNRSQENNQVGVLTVTVSLNGETNSKSIDITVVKGTTLYREYGISYQNVEDSTGLTDKYKVSCYNPLVDYEPNGNYIFKGWRVAGSEQEPFKYLPFKTSGPVVLEPVLVENVVEDIKVEIKSGEELLNVTALDSLDQSLITVYEVYTNGTEVEISDYSVTYETLTDSFEYGNTIVTISNGTYSKEVSIAVEKKVSDILPNREDYDQEVVFDGNVLSYALPISDVVLGNVSYTVSFKNNEVISGTTVNTYTGTLVFTSQDINYKDLELEVSLEITKLTINSEIVLTAQMNSDGLFVYLGDALVYTHKYADVASIDAEDPIKAILTNYAVTNEASYVLRDSENNVVTEISETGKYSIELEKIVEDNYEIVAEIVEFNVVEKPSVTPVNPFLGNTYLYGDTLPTTVVFTDNKGETVTVDSYEMTYDKTPGDVGSYTLTVSWTSAEYGNGSIDFALTIEEKDISELALISAIEDQVYTGTKISPVLEITYGSVLVLGTDYEVVYPGENINVGNYAVEVTFIGNYEGSKTVYFDIVELSLTDNTDIVITITEEGLVYTGQGLTPAFTVTGALGELEVETDYTFEFTDNVNAGTATLTVTGVNNYAGEASVTFEIGKAVITSEMISGVEESYIYTGSAITPTVVVTFNGVILTLDTDYEVEYRNNTEVSTESNEAIIDITGMGNFKVETISVNFLIISVDTIFDDAKAEIDNFVSTEYNNGSIVEAGANFPVSYKGVSISYSVDPIGLLAIDNTTGMVSVINPEENKVVNVTVNMEFNDYVDSYSFSLTIEKKVTSTPYTATFNKTATAKTGYEARDFIVTDNGHTVIDTIPEDKTNVWSASLTNCEKEKFYFGSNGKSASNTKMNLNSEPFSSLKSAFTETTLKTYSAALMYRGTLSNSKVTFNWDSATQSSGDVYILVSTDEINWTIASTATLSSANASSISANVTLENYHVALVLSHTAGLNLKLTTFVAE